MNNAKQGLSPYEEGQLAYTKGKHQFDNPYHPVTQSDEFDDWSIGMFEAQYETAEA